MTGDKRSRGRPKESFGVIIGVALSILLLVSCSPLTSLDVPKSGQGMIRRMPTVVLSEEEQAYLQRRSVFTVGLSDGVAPLFYIDSKGQVQGIGVRILEEVAHRTGFSLRYHALAHHRDVYDYEIDLFPLISPNYAPDEMILSTPYLITETVLFINRNVSRESLEGKRIAAIEGWTAPLEIGDELVNYYPTREAAIDAVERGEADYGYANAYSVAYLSLKKGYRNLVIVPQGIEVRHYSVGVFNNDQILLSIINKGLASITETQMQALIFDEASRIERTITVSMIMEQYGPVILLISFGFIVVLIYLSVNNIHAAVLLKRQNHRYEALFEISREYLFEYEQRSRRVILAPQTIALFGSERRQAQAMQVLTAVLRATEERVVCTIVDLKIHDGSSRTFRLNTVRATDPLKRETSYIGKLSDISEEEREKAVLRVRVVTDGLTGLLNQVAFRVEIENVLSVRPANRLDLLVLMDCDQFKQINDTYGHLAGDRFLKILGESLVGIFDDHAIIGRVGGDEFCVYVPSARSVEEVIALCHTINPTFQKQTEAPFTVSIGATVVQDGDAYDTLFRRADSALYAVKREGGAAVLLDQPTPGS